MIQINWTHGGMFVSADCRTKVSDARRCFTAEWDGPSRTLRVTIDGKDVPMDEGQDGVWRERLVQDQE